MSPTPAPHFRNSQTSATAPMPILMLEDERFDRHRLARLCSALEFPSLISNATTLHEFATALDEENFGLILLDYGLPDGTGLDALEMVRLSARNVNAPTLMISGMTQKDVMDKAQLAGCAGFLSKDALTKKSFCDAVQGLVSRASSPISPDQKVFGPSELAALVGDITHRNAHDIKPMVSRMLRQLRGLRTADAAQDGVTLQAVEQNCMSLWAYLIEMEREDGTAILEEMRAGNDAKSAHPPRPVQDATKSRRPPSPFGRTRH